MIQKFKKYFHNKNQKNIANYVRSKEIFKEIDIDNLIKIIEFKFEHWMNWNNFNSNNTKLFNEKDNNTWSWNIKFINKYNTINELWSSDNIILSKNNLKIRNPSINSKFFYLNKYWYFFKSKNQNEDNYKYIIDNQNLSYQKLQNATNIKRESIKFFISINNNENDAKELYNKRINRRKEYLKKYYYKSKSKPDNFIRTAISKKIANYLRNISKSKNSKMSKYLPYSIKELKENLESKFEYWMNWNNYGTYNPNTWNDNDISTWTWNLDHIIPHSKFKYKSVNDELFKNCWSLDNLRPYSSKLNCIDGAKKIRH